MSENTASHKTNWETLTLLSEFRGFLDEMATNEIHWKTIDDFQLKNSLGEWFVDLVRDFVERQSECECKFRNLLFSHFIAQIDFLYIGNFILEVRTKYKLAHDITVPN